MIEPHVLADVLSEYFEFFVVLPDSRSFRLINGLRRIAETRVIQVTDEAAAVGIAAGITVANKTCLVIIESSGLRRGFEALGRLSGSHGVHPVILATDRGVLGDAEWWAAMHHPHARSVATVLGAKTAELGPAMTDGVIADVLARAARQHRSQQCPVILWLHPDLLVA